MKYSKIFTVKDGLKTNGIHIFIMCLILFYFMPPLVEAKTADEDARMKLQKAPGFEIIFAIAGLVMITHLLRRKG